MLYHPGLSAYQGDWACSHPLLHPARRRRRRLPGELPLAIAFLIISRLITRSLSRCTPLQGRQARPHSVGLRIPLAHFQTASHTRYAAPVPAASLAAPLRSQEHSCKSSVFATCDSTLHSTTLSSNPGVVAQSSQPPVWSHMYRRGQTSLSWSPTCG
jgi:hypothetical protein